MLGIKLKKGHGAVIIGLLLIIAFAFLLRCLHLFDHDHYYIISPDSYFFHWVAQGIMAGKPLPNGPGAQVSFTLHSGLAYPLAYIAKAVSFVFGLSNTDALTLVGKFLPPCIGVITILLLFWFATKVYGVKVGLFATFAMAIFSLACFVQAAGYLDRDGLSLLLIMAGVFVFYLARNFHLKASRWDIGWVLAVLLILVIEVLLYLEWKGAGAALLLIILIAYVAFEFLVTLYQRTQVSLKENEELSTWAASMRNIVPSLQKTDWRLLALVIGISALALIPDPGLAKQAISGVTGIFAPRAVSTITEMQGLPTGNIIFYFGFLLIPLVLGLWIAAKRRRRVDILCLSWFIALFFAALFAQRLIIYTAPAVCLLSGLGLAYLWEFRHSPAFLRLVKRVRVTLPPRLGLVRVWDSIESPAFIRRLVRVGTVLLLLLLILVGYSQAYLGGSGYAAASSDWQEALVYLRENSPPDAVVMSHSNWGYWILDIAQRRPVVDGGLYGWDEKRMQDIGLAYCTNDTAQAAQIMRQYGADYIIFGKDDVQLLPRLSDYGLGKAFGDGKSVPPELEDSLYNRSLFGDFQSEDGLTVVHRFPEVNPEVVILALSPG